MEREAGRRPIVVQDRARSVGALLGPDDPGDLEGERFVGLEAVVSKHGDDDAVGELSGRDEQASASLKSPAASTMSPCRYSLPPVCMR